MFGRLLPSNTAEATDVYNSISVNQSTTDDEVLRVYSVQSVFGHENQLKLSVASKYANIDIWMKNIESFVTRASKET